MSEHLLPCPFCGGPANFEDTTSTKFGLTTWSVGCANTDEDCIGYQMLAHFSRKSEAAEAWNKRATQSSAVSAPMRSMTPQEEEAVQRSLLASGTPLYDLPQTSAISAELEARLALADELMLPGGTHPYLGAKKRNMIVAALRARTEPQTAAEPSPCAYTGYVPHEGDEQVLVRIWGFGRPDASVKDVRLLYSFPPQTASVREAILMQALETAAGRLNMMAGVGLVNGADPKVGYRECMDALKSVRSQAEIAK